MKGRSTWGEILTIISKITTKLWLITPQPLKSIPNTPMLNTTEDLLTMISKITTKLWLITPQPLKSIPNQLMFISTEELLTKISKITKMLSLISNPPFLWVLTIRFTSFRSRFAAMNSEKRSFWLRVYSNANSRSPLNPPLKFRPISVSQSQTWTSSALIWADSKPKSHFDFQSDRTY